MSGGTLALLRTRRFLPLFLSQFLGAFNDNVFKNAMVILITFRLAEAAGYDPRVLATVAAGVFILPFFLFSATAGRFADRFEKSRLIAVIKACEIAFMALAALGLLTGSVGLLFAVLFLMGVHSAFFGPLKYSILPAHLEPEELLAGNALVEAGTYLAILLGTIAGGLLILTGHGIEAVSAGVILVAVAGLAASLFIPRAAPAAPELRLGFNIARETVELVLEARRRRDVFLAILGISWFWLVGATFLSQFPAYAKNVLGADGDVVTLFLAAFSIGVGLGSLLCSRLLRGEVSARYVPVAALGISLFGFDLYAASGRLHGTGELIGVAAYLSTFGGWRVLADLALIAVCGGLYAVPLYTILQARSESARRSRVIAANNVLNAAFMVAAAALTVAMLALQFTTPDVFLAVAAANLAVALYLRKLLPATATAAAER
jgi:acyl-[acyl-carrier-protein]-phospholipid O-acyltransferase/long-chain-fatty-acid--[acyl-carrier-protein] ligase